jgi:hypothetical protein
MISQADVDKLLSVRAMEASVLSLYLQVPMDAQLSDASTHRHRVRRAGFMPARTRLRRGISGRLTGSAG